MTHSAGLRSRRFTVVNTRRILGPVRSANAWKASFLTFNVSKASFQACPTPRLTRQLS